MIYLSILCICLLAISYICSNENIFSPGVLTNSIWLVCIGLWYILPHHLPPLSSNFIFAISLWISLLTVTALLLQAVTIPSSIKDIKPSILIKDIYFWLSIATIPLLISFVYNAITHGSSGNWMYDLRMAAIGENGEEEVYTPFYSLLWIATYLLYLYNTNRNNWLRTMILGLMVFSFSFACMSKIMILNFVVMTLFILYIKKIVTTKHIVIILCVLFFGLITLQGLRHAIKMDETGVENTLITYFLSSMSAFDTLDPNSSAHYAENSFRLVYAIKYKLGVSTIEPVETLLPWISKPIPTNTYTTLYPFYKDFGVWGIGIFAIIAGIIYGSIFKQVLKKNHFFILLWAYLSMIVITQYVADALFTNLAGHIKMVILLYIPFFASKYHLFEKNKQ
ncbi:MAG: O-antigen ligase [Paludibacteraceae bacterium]|nr:O-antigen ligase [Paludibacteraceae bacterium]